jgi:hypothetical protein
MGICWNWIMPELDNAGAQIHLTVDGDVPIVLADVDQIKQVFFNIIKNSMEAMRRRKCLSISVGSDDDSVLLKSADTSMGKVFEPLCTSEKQGTGLGTFIVVESKPDTEATVTLKFPRKVHSPRMLYATDGKWITIALMGKPFPQLGTVVFALCRGSTSNLSQEKKWVLFFSSRPNGPFCQTKKGY